MLVFCCLGGILKKFIFILFLLSFSLVAEDDSFGSKNCSQCHKKAYDIWVNTKHYKADDSLTEEQKNDPKCNTCHKPSINDKGVSCEDCHGNGKYYAKDYVMKDKELSKILGLKKVKPETCKKCHNKYSTMGKEIDFEKEMKTICIEKE